MQSKDINGKHFLITGAAGFIGFHLSRRLCEEGARVSGIDNLNDYYDVGLKKMRLKELEVFDKFEFKRIDIADRHDMEELFNRCRFDMVVHLAAQAGIRYSLENPHSYIDSNVLGFLNILEGCKSSNLRNLVYASSSSVYGGNRKLPFSERDRVDKPVSLYAVTKITNELMATCYSHLYDINTVGLRLFTVYGPWGRPDMSYFKFTKNIMEGVPIQVYNYGNHVRSFTYIDDVVDSICKLIENLPLRTSSNTNGIYNIGGESPLNLKDYIREIEKAIGKRAELEYLPLQKGEVERTEVDTSALNDLIGSSPKTEISKGIFEFIKWYKEYHRIKD